MCEKKYSNSCFSKEFSIFSHKTGSKSQKSCPISIYLHFVTHQLQSQYSTLVKQTEDSETANQNVALYLHLYLILYRRDSCLLRVYLHFAWFTLYLIISSVCLTITHYLLIWLILCASAIVRAYHSNRRSKLWLEN